MNKSFLLRYVRPLLRATGLYALAHALFFRTLDWRARRAVRRTVRTEPTAAVLLYHRVDSVSRDPAKLCVTPDTFEKHLQFLKGAYDVVSLAELTDRLARGTLTGKEAVITFDDGYRDNLTNALPLLEQYGLPAAIFITTGSLGERASFEWDMEYPEKGRAWFMSEEEVRQIAHHELISIGAHTRTHARLASLEEQTQAAEIRSSKEDLERITGKPISSFAYPFGGPYDFDRSSTRIAVEAGFETLCTTTHALVTGASSPLALPRMNIRECPVEELSRMLQTDRRVFPEMS